MLSFQAESRNLLLFLNCEIFRDVSASLDMTKAQKSKQCGCSHDVGCLFDNRCELKCDG